MSKYIEYERLKILFRKITQPLPKTPSKPETPLNGTFYMIPTRFGLERFHGINIACSYLARLTFDLNNDSLVTVNYCIGKHTNVGCNLVRTLPQLRVLGA